MQASVSSSIQTLPDIAALLFSASNCNSADAAPAEAESFLGFFTVAQDSTARMDSLFEASVPLRDEINPEQLVFSGIPAIPLAHPLVVYTLTEAPPVPDPSFIPDIQPVADPVTFEEETESLTPFDSEQDVPSDELSPPLLDVPALTAHPAHKPRLQPEHPQVQPGSLLMPVVTADNKQPEIPIRTAVTAPPMQADPNQGNSLDDGPNPEPIIPFAFAVEIKNRPGPQADTPKTTDPNPSIPASQTDKLEFLEANSSGEKNSNGEGHREDSPEQPISKSVTAARLNLEKEISALAPANTADPHKTSTPSPKSSSAVSRPLLAEPESPKSAFGSLNHLRLRVDDGLQQRVDVRVDGRAGDIRISVHTADGRLNQALRHDIHDLVSVLSAAGMESNPVSPRHELDTSSREEHRGGGQSNGGFTGQRQQREQNPQEEPEFEITEESRNQ